MYIPKFIRLTDHTVVTETDLDPFCTTPSPYFKPNEEEYAPIRDWAQPYFEQYTQKCVELAPALLDNIWTQQWEIQDLTGEELEAAQERKLSEDTTKEEQRIASLWQAAHDYEYEQLSGSAVGLLAMGVMQGKLKCVAVQNWIKGIWELYYTRKATLSTDTDYNVCGNCPYTVPELMEELGV